MDSKMLTDRVGSRLERTLELSDGEQIVAFGDHGGEMFIVLEGEVRISRPGRDDVAVVRRGGFFGEMSVLESSPRDAYAHAQGPVRLLAIGQGGLLVRLRRDPSFALEMLHALSGRIRTLNALVSALSDDPPPVGP